ncbi:hypothetical protein HNR23_004509 [Nocardiopsis mwathae]|uniref:VanZ-like domain-containing protein n=1 Tax=Nocardiopsis mwathae TaxID=1472723 RepID=A0A7W9YLZ7_9ACTN|nr:VanZ family protein [Nocardiopsis mwathae]MBB6174449.1 hypothetical protein [Nocardiopsis mwathae]
MLILIPPLSDISEIGQTDREVIWDPLVSFKEDDEIVEGSYIPLVGSDDTYIYYGEQELSEEEVERAREQASSDDAAYYRYPLTNGTSVWFDSEGHDLDPQMRAELESSYPPEEYLGGNDATEGLVVAEKVLNALIFIPIGIIAFASFFSWWARVCVGPALSVIIEFGQWYMAAGRVSETADVIMNSAGHVIGVGMLAAAALLVDRRPAEARHRIRS